MMMHNKKDRVFSRGVEIEVCKRPDPKIRLYDYRLIQREPLQSYEGHVNSHTRIQLGVDPYERFFMSGEEDCNLRLWSIKSSELLFEDNFMDFVPSIVCWLKGTDLGAALVNLEIGVQSWCFVVKVTFCHYNLIIRVSPLSFELEATLKLARFLCRRELAKDVVELLTAAADGAKSLIDASDRLILYVEVARLFGTLGYHRKAAFFSMEIPAHVGENPPKLVNVENGSSEGDTKANETPIEEPETEAKVLDIPSPCSMDIDSQTSNQLPQVINGVPKGLRIEDVLGRIAVLLLIRDKVANFEYIDEVEAAAEEEAQKASTKNKTTTNNPDRASYWEESLKDRYEVQKFEEFNAMGKGNRSRKQMVSVEDEDLAGLEDVSSEGEDNNCEAELTDGETAASGILTGRRPYRKKIRVDSAESLPLMEGEGRSFRVKGFNQNQRAAFVQIMMRLFDRFGVGEFDWAEFTPRLKQKTCEEIKEYGTLFLTHIAEDITDSPTFSDGVPKEGLRIEDVLVRIAVLLLIRDKVKAASEKPGTPLFPDDIESRFPGLKSGRFWKEHHDLLLLRAVLNSGACQTSHWKSGHKTKCKDFQLSGQVKSMLSAYMQHGRRDSSAVALVLSSGTVNITKQSKEILFPYEDFVELFNWDKRGFPPCGLLNCGNSCNVVLQCLVYTRPLVAYLLEKGHRKECRRNDWCFLCEFQTHVKRSSESRHPFSPINILSRLPNIGGDLGYGKQEDAHEFMRFAIDIMQSVCLDEFGGEKALHPSTQETTLIHHIFGGHLQSQVICSKCNNVSNQYENMMDLTVEIQGDATSLEECLDLFTVRERLHEDNMYKCDGCNEYVMAWKRLTVRRAPNILTIALKRFQSGRFGKLNKRVTFPETLDLSPYMSEVDGNDVYKLYAVVVHVDMLNASFFGHYICYTKDFCGKWYRIDDCKVMRVDLEEVLSQGAYMLLYSRVCARPSCLKPIESLTKGKQQTVQEGEPHVKQSVEFLTTAESINGVCTSGSLSSDSDSQEKVSTCEKERTNSEDVREDIEMIDSESSSSVPQDIEVHGNGYSHAIEETASPVVHANRLVSAVGSSLSEMVKPEAYSQNSESNFPHSAVDENQAERSSAERLTESSSESAQPIQNGVCEEGNISHDAPVGNLSSGELLDEISPVDCNGEQAKMETGKGLPSSSSTKDATGKLARRNSSEGKLKPLFPPGFLRKHSGNNSPKRGGKAKAPSELAECASSYNPNKVILVDLQNLVFLIKMVRGQKMWGSLILSAVVLRLLLLRNELGITWTRTLWCSVDLVILITAMEILVLLLFLMRALAILVGMTNNWQGKPRATRRSSMRVKLHPKRSEQILKDRWKVTCNLSEDDSTTQILFEASTLSMDLHLRLKS